MNHPRMGERVVARPTNPRVPVQRGAGLFGQFLPPEGQEVLWDQFLHQRLAEGSIAWAPVAAAIALRQPAAATALEQPGAAIALEQPAAAASDAQSPTADQPKEPQ